MRQFDIVENLNPLTSGRYPLVVVLQHDRVSTFSVLVVAPLVRSSPALTATRLHPSIAVDGRDFVAMVEELASVHRRTLGRVFGTAEHRRYEIIRAIDLLFTGI